MTAPGYLARLVERATPAPIAPGPLPAADDPFERVALDVPTPAPSPRGPAIGATLPASPESPASAPPLAPPAIEPAADATAAAVPVVLGERPVTREVTVDRLVTPPLQPSPVPAALSTAAPPPPVERLVPVVGPADAITGPGAAPSEAGEPRDPLVRADVFMQRLLPVALHPPAVEPVDRPRQVEPPGIEPRGIEPRGIEPPAGRPAPLVPAEPRRPVMPAPALAVSPLAAAEPSVVIGAIHVEVRPPQPAPPAAVTRTVVVAPAATSGSRRPSSQRFGLGQT